MFYNYWNYPLYLWIYIKRLLKGNKDNHKLYKKANGYGDDKVKVFILQPGELFTFNQPQITATYSTNLFFPKGIVAYRIYWKDGTKSRWFVPGVNEIEDFSKTHKREIIVSV